VSQRQFPQNRELVQDFERLLKRQVSEVRDYTAAFHRRWARRGVTTIRGAGWAVRPFLVPADRLDFIASTFHQGMAALREALREASARPGGVHKLFPYHPLFQGTIDVVDGVWSSAFLSHFRPDGFLFEDRYVLSELNYGNGVLVSCGYTEAVADYWRGHPVLKRLGWDVDRLHRRPLPWLISVARRFARPVPRPTVAMVAHSEEWKVIKSYPKRVIDQMRFARDEFRKAGLRARLVTETEVELDRKGQPRFLDGTPVDLVMLITIGSSFMDAPELVAADGPLAHFARARIGDTWVLKPLAGLVFDKGALPLLARLPFTRRTADGFRFEVARTERPHGKQARHYTAERERWVLKRAFDGKDTHVGVTHSAPDWRRAVDAAVESHSYVAQEYVSLPRARVPVFVDEKHLEWVDSRVELSSFIFDGAFGGAAGRHAPDAEGVVMTDTPEGYGFTTVFST
jgi:hypothetical protein